MKESPRKIAVVTGGRFDFTRYRPILAELTRHPDVAMRLMPTGGHFAPAFGRTIAEVEAAGYAYEPGLEMLLASDSSALVGKAVGLGTISFAQAFAVDRPDILVVLGDRFEMLCAPIAALGFNIPVAHIHGGAVTEGAIDELVRHALTKMSHLHFVAIDEYRRRLIQMGEEPWRVATVGAPVLDEILATPRMPPEEVAAGLDLDVRRPTILAAYHPVTLESDSAAAQVAAMLEALAGTDDQLVLTYPNPDLGSSAIIERLEKFAAAHKSRARLIKNAGSRLFLGLMGWADAMIGNSSAGIVEAASFALPTVNIGTRQDGKVRGANVIDCGNSTADIRDALARARSEKFRAEIKGMRNPYGDGKAAPRIVEILRNIPLDGRLIRKKFVDLPTAAIREAEAKGAE